MSWLLSKSVSFVQTVYRIINTSYYIKFKTGLRYEILITVIGPSRVQFGLYGIRAINNIGRTVKQESDLLIMSMITDRIGRHEVLLPINQNYDKIWERN